MKKKFNLGQKKATDTLLLRTLAPKACNKKTNSRQKIKTYLFLRLNELYHCFFYLIKIIFLTLWNPGNSGTRVQHIYFIDRWSRLWQIWSWFGCRSIYRYRPETELSDQASYLANQSSEEVEGELMDHGYVVGRKGTTGLMKLSKVVLHNVFIRLSFLRYTGKLHFFIKSSLIKLYFIRIQTPTNHNLPKSPL